MHPHFISRMKKWRAAARGALASIRVAVAVQSAVEEGKLHALDSSFLAASNQQHGHDLSCRTLSLRAAPHAHSRQRTGQTRLLAARDKDVTKCASQRAPSLCPSAGFGQ